MHNGTLSGAERTAHFELAREAESMKESLWMRGQNPRDQQLFVPINEFVSTRQVSVTARFPIGLETFGASNLRTWSACARAGANFLTGLSRNCNLWEIGALPVPQWLPELGMVTPSDPV